MSIDLYSLHKWYVCPNEYLNLLCQVSHRHICPWLYIYLHIYYSNPVNIKYLPPINDFTTYQPPTRAENFTILFLLSRFYESLYEDIAHRLYEDIYRFFRQTFYEDIIEQVGSVIKDIIDGLSCNFDQGFGEIFGVQKIRGVFRRP